MASYFGFCKHPLDLGDKNIPSDIQQRRVPFIKRVQEDNALYPKAGYMNLMDKTKFYHNDR